MFFPERGPRPYREVARWKSVAGRPLFWFPAQANARVIGLGVKRSKRPLAVTQR